MSEFSTQRLDAFKPQRKADTIKALTPIVIAALSLVGSVLIAMFQFSNSDQIDENSKKASEDTKAAEQKIEVIVSQLNTSIIPAMQATIQGLVDKNVELRERIVVLETKFSMKKEEDFIHKVKKWAGKKTEMKKEMKSIPKLRMKK